MSDTVKLLEPPKAKDYQTYEETCMWPRTPGVG
jgi:hypothetical protein